MLGPDLRLHLATVILMRFNNKKVKTFDKI